MGQGPDTPKADPNLQLILHNFALQCLKTMEYSVMDVFGPLFFDAWSISISSTYLVGQ